jgi:hypothetical protein
MTYDLPDASLKDEDLGTFLSKSVRYDIASSPR